MTTTAQHIVVRKVQLLAERCTRLQRDNTDLIEQITLLQGRVDELSCQVAILEHRHGRAYALLHAIHCHGTTHLPPDIATRLQTCLSGGY